MAYSQPRTPEEKQSYRAVQNVCKHMSLYHAAERTNHAALAAELYLESCRHVFDGLTSEAVHKLWGRIVCEFCNELETVDECTAIFMKEVVLAAVGHISDRDLVLQSTKDALEEKLAAANYTIQKLSQQNAELSEKIAKLEAANAEWE